MSQRNGAKSPSPDSHVEVFSYRSSRAGSEAPQRAHDSLARSPRSCRSSRAGSEAPQRIRDGPQQQQQHSLRSSPGNVSISGDVRIEDEDMIARDGVAVKDGYSNSKRIRKHAVAAAGAGGWSSTNTKGHRRTSHTNEAREMENALYHSVPHAGWSFKFLQKLCYPFDVPAPLGNDPSKSCSSNIDESAEYEATGELHITNAVELPDTRSVLRNETDNVENGVSTLAMCMMPDPVQGSPVLALCIGDVNGRINYCELEVNHVKHALSSSCISRKSKSNISTGSRSQTDVDITSYATSLISDQSFYSDIYGFQRPPLRKHSHQAYVREMDCLTSTTISQSVKTLSFLRQHESPNTISYLTSNERVIKLFRVQREGFSPFHAFPSMEAVIGKRLAYTRYFPRAAPSFPILPVRVFSGCHMSPVQDLSVCADGESFLSVDDLQVFWWNMECEDTSKGTCIADYRPLSGRMDEVEELVTSAAFHPTHSSLFLVSLSSGLLGIGDLRDSASGAARKYSSSVRINEDSNFSMQEQYGEVLCSISGADFLGSCHVVTRDYLSLKLWDLRRTDKPYSVAPVMNYVTPYLDSLYENDSIFDRFPVAVDHISNTVVTGLYDGAAAVWQPFQNGRIPPEDVLVHYHADPLALPCEVENGGRTTVEALGMSLARGWKTPTIFAAATCSLATNAGDDEMNAGVEPAVQMLQDDIPEPIANKTVCLAVADGGERFALTCNDGRYIMVFERKTSTDNPVASVGIR
ncbi:uncharacterized protein TM35_000171860 [Trypanosoma theileri]|uniref:Serine/threonine-protein phosphatase 2A 55 kDa regulatory subunit B n=1 Tax=Trypanosoma theileri TaxID=67003 RepID=A0A1X0NUC6_9TRYP|nr:uncharacterized protein TM35_000171860 [Trypanosoma theileri]ORC88314.1 hypothetical protein TM35_000171860 [Trypanosoma theileri]